MNVEFLMKGQGQGQGQRHLTTDGADKTDGKARSKAQGREPRK